jgi:hypothetical protein
MGKEKMSELESASAFPLDSFNGKVDVVMEQVPLEKRTSAHKNSWCRWLWLDSL